MSPKGNDMAGDELRKAVGAAIFDPGTTEGYRGDRTLTEWQIDAVMRVLARLSRSTSTDAVAVTVAQLQAAHIERQEEWCPEQKPDLSFRGNEMAGEVGEACNVIKKLERERHGWRGSRATKEQLAEELADVVHTATLCAITADIDLGPAVVAKFNATSEKNGLATRIAIACPSLQGGAEPDDRNEEWLAEWRRQDALYTHSLGETGGTETGEEFPRSLCPGALPCERLTNMARAHGEAVAAHRLAESSLAAEKLKVAGLTSELAAMRASRDGLADEINAAQFKKDRDQQRVAALVGALTPDADTKAVYIGEFKFSIEDRDEDGEECQREVVVPWTTVKEIMKAISARAALATEA